MGAFDALAVHDACGGMLVAPQVLAQTRSQRVVDALPQPLSTPQAKVEVDALPCGKVQGQHPPLHPAHQDVKDGVDDFAHTQGAWSPAEFDQRVG